MSQGKKKTTSEVKSSAPKKVSTSEVQADTLTLNEYLEKVKVSTGLVASFRVEIGRKPSLADPKTAEEWKATLDRQSKKVYK